MLYYADKNWYHFIKEYLGYFSEFSFQEVAGSVGRLNRHIFEILLAHRHILVAQNREKSVKLHHCLVTGTNPNATLITMSNKSKHGTAVKLHLQFSYPTPEKLLKL